MLIDALNLLTGTILEAVICIIGSGPAGLSLATELDAAGISTLLLEAGGTGPEPEDAGFVDGETSGDPFCPLGVTRARGIGGTANLWDTRWDPANTGFRGGPLDAIDFERREWVPMSGWPFSRRELDPFYVRAHEFSRFGPFEYDSAHWESDGARSLPFPDGSFETRMWLFGAQRTILHERRAALEHSPNTRVVTHARVTALDADPAGSGVRTARIETAPGKWIEARAHYFVLAAGGIENARLLLDSSAIRCGGIGNGHGLVGRFFCEHQMVRGGTITPSDPHLFDRLALYDERHVRGTPVMGKLRPSDRVMREEGLLNVALSVLPRHRRAHRFQWQSLDDFLALARSARARRLPEQPLRRAASVARGGDFVAARLLRKLSGNRLFQYWEDGPSLLSPGWSSLPAKTSRFGRLEVTLYAEQAPHPDNRVTLSEQRDPLGHRKARLHWEWRPADIESVGRTQQLLKEALGRGGFGRFDIAECDGRPPLLHAGLHHHMGTTRIHPNPRQGVVNADCRVHDTPNLFVAGSSVFPTGGYINPTLTIIALAIRLADHLKCKVGRKAERLPKRSPSRMRRVGIEPTT